MPKPWGLSEGVRIPPEKPKPLEEIIETPDWEEAVDFAERAIEAFDRLRRLDEYISTKERAELLDADVETVRRLLEGEE